MRRLLGFVLFVIGACGGAPPPERPSPAPPPPVAPAAPSAVPATSAPSSPKEPTRADAGVELPALADAKVARILEVSIHSVAFGAAPRVAGVGDAVWLDTGKGMRQLPDAGASLARVSVFFGRDDQPRLMGYERDDARPVYRRWRAGAWERAANEIGRLGSTRPGALFGTLGDEDPEVVCKQGEVCIIKRRTGWQTVELLPGLPRVALHQGDVWAVDGASLWHLGKAGFEAVGGGLPFSAATFVWPAAAADIWVVEPSTSTLHRFDGSRWSRTASPVSGPRAVWASGSRDVWVVGDAGAAHWDGASWSRVEGVPGPLVTVLGRTPEDVWLGGDAGLYRCVRPPADQH
jgi:hypothetical protein